MKAKKKSKLCPICGWDTIPIVYGLPSERDFERDDIILGGCIVDDMNPDLACTMCDWSGQEWHLRAPLPPSVWVILDRAGILAPIGLVAGRFDEILETFQLGHWLNVTFTKQYEEWLEAATERPLALTAPFADLSPGLIAEMRLGDHGFEASELYEAGFQGLTNPPRFDFNGRMQPLEG